MDKTGTEAGLQVATILNVNLGSDNGCSCPEHRVQVSTARWPRKAAEKAPIKELAKVKPCTSRAAVHAAAPSIPCVRCAKQACEGGEEVQVANWGRGPHAVVSQET